MKVLMLTHTYFPSVGGGIRYKTAVVEHLRQRGHEVDVLALSDGEGTPAEKQSGGQVFRADSQVSTPLAPISFSYLWWYRRLIGNYDALLFNFPSPMEEIGEVVFGNRANGARKVVMYHADIVDAKPFSRIYNRMITMPFLQAMDAILVSSPKVPESSRHLAPHRHKVHVIPFGINLEEYGKPVPCSTKYDKNVVRLLFVGRMARYKGVDVLLRAFAQTDGGRLRLVGDGPLKERLESLAEELGVGDRVEFLGRVSDQRLIEEYHAADVFVLPSTDAGEAFGYVLIEAMAGRNAIISTELGTGTSYVNQHGETGLVVDPNDVIGLADALTFLINAHERRHEMQEAAYMRVSQHFDIHRMLRENEAVITGSAR